MKRLWLYLKPQGKLVFWALFLATMSQMLGSTFDGNSAKDSKANLNAWLGKDKIGREYIIEQAGTLAIKKGDWKFIKSGKGARFNPQVNIELGNDVKDQLYNLKTDPNEKNNVSTEQKEKLTELKSLLEQELNK